MNFFEHQAQARRKTSLLVAYFVAAVLAIGAAVSSAVFLLLWWSSGGSMNLTDWWQSELFAATIVGTLMVILGGSLWKIWQLRDGGAALAHMLKAREVLPDAKDSDERRYRNVVEEMAIASGIPAPLTYVLDGERAINAFVAGFRPTEAVVVITEGTLKDLDRDELQGVIAHEFSHIFNADMRLNMRLLAVLSGILTIGRLGGFLLRGSAHRGRRYRSSANGDARGQAFILVLGLTLMVIGYVGLFFGRLIKAAISRQRELLADASSVQFTRNPAGIAGALIKIRNGSGAQLQSAHAEDMSHMCFGQAVTYNLQGLLATHPPVDERLSALGPEWVARARVRAKAAPGTSTDASQAQPAPEGSAAFAGETVSPPPSAPTPAAETQTVSSPSQLIGTVTPEQMGYASTLLQLIPDQLKERIHSPRTAQLTMFAMVLSAARSDNSELKLVQLSPREMDDVIALREQLTELGTRLRLPIVDLSLPALKQLDQAQAEAFLDQLQLLVEADQRITLFEYALTRILADHLSSGAARNHRVRFRRYSQVHKDIQLVFSTLAHTSGGNPEKAAASFARVTGALLPAGTALLDAPKCSIRSLDQSLENLRDLTPMLKGPLVDTLADLVLEDGKVQVAEAELLRAICTLLDCPVPPLSRAA